MKTSLTAVLFLMAQTLYSEEVAETTKYARRHGARARIVLRCVDQDGQVVSNATVMSGVSLDGNPETTTQVNGKTDTNGCFVVYGKSNGELGYYCKKAGYYNTCETKHLDQFPGAFVSDGRWQPYGATNTVVLKRMVNPVAMRVASLDGKNHNIPAVAKEIGFDLFENDWIAPDGKGKYADLYVLFDWDGTKYQNYTGSALTLVFKGPYSGIYKVATDGFSEFRSPYHADTNAAYATKIEFRHIRGKSFSDSFNGQLKGTECLILRFRTKVDENGSLISSHYAKIYAPMMFGYALETPGSMEMRCYLNPNANDPSLEADTTKNLLNPRDLGFPP